MGDPRRERDGRNACDAGDKDRCAGESVVLMQVCAMRCETGVREARGIEMMWYANGWSWRGRHVER